MKIILVYSIPYITPHLQVKKLLGVESCHGSLLFFMFSHRAEDKCFQLYVFSVSSKDIHYSDSVSVEMRRDNTLYSICLPIDVMNPFIFRVHVPLMRELSEVERMTSSVKQLRVGWFVLSCCSLSSPSLSSSFSSSFCCCCCFFFFLFCFVLFCFCFEFDSAVVY